MRGAIVAAVLAIIMVGMGFYADSWRAKDPQARRDQSPPGFVIATRFFLLGLLAALAYAIFYEIKT